MSNSTYVWALLLLSLAGPALAQGTFPGAAEMGEALATMTTRSWQGARAPRPDVARRPPTQMLAEGVHVRIHGAGTHYEAARRLVPALEGFAAFMEAAAFRLPQSDGGRGGDDRFDLYFMPLADRIEASVDADDPMAYHDAVHVHGRVDPLTCFDLIECGLQAFGEAYALARLPEESPGWHRAFASWLVWRYTGRLPGMEEQQREAQLPWIGTRDEQERMPRGGGGLLLAYLDERTGGRGVFVRELFELARQRTWDGTLYRGSPDLWQALDVALDRGGDRSQSFFEDVAADRGLMALGQRSPLLGLSAPSELSFVVDGADLPEHTEPGPELAPLGSAFALVDVGGTARVGRRLRIWLRGEYGVEWSLTAIRLDANGEDLGRLSAPPRRGDRRSYLPVELDGDTVRVLVVVTNLSHRLPESDEAFDPNGRAFRLIFDFADDEE